MRILMPCATFPPVIDGGGTISALMLAKMLVSEGHDVRVVHVGDRDQEEVYEGIRVHRIPSLNLYWDYYKPRAAWKKAAWHLLENGNPRAYVAMRREIRAFAPDIVLTVSIENINVATWAAARSLGVPVAHTLHSAFLMCWKGVMQRNGRNCERQCRSCRLTSIGKRQFSRLVDTVIGESNDVIKRHRVEGYFPNAITRRIPATIKKIYADAPRQLPTDRPARIGFIGVHTAFKGLGVLAEAAALMPAEARVEFFIAGSGRDAFAEEIRKRFPAESTQFLGWSAPDAFLDKIDVLAVPTIGREAFGRVVVEAFSHAVPVVGTNLGGIAETIRPGVNGYQVPPSDPAALKDSLLQVLAEPRHYRELSTGALASAGEYLQDTVAAAYTDVLGETLSGAQRASGSLFTIP
jgi:glycosyltransferase involved in cell wall biosynthesis